MIPRFLFTAAVLAIPATLAGQVATVGQDASVDVAHDPGDVLGTARDAQARFERTRLRHARLVFSTGGGDCDEYVGRFCTSFDEGEWYPREEAIEVVDGRSRLLSQLDSLQRSSPSDAWILGQRVWYRGETGDWSSAAEVARACGPEQTWWCAALEGLALHGLGQHGAALEAFEAALVGADPEVAREWRVPERTVDRGLRAILTDAAEAGPDSLAAALATVWMLADPLYLVDGNDRLTAHYARWTVATLRDRARNPFHISWGRDLEELTVRHGWEMGWERSASRSFGSVENVIGHKHPEGRDYMPSGRALGDLSNAPAEALRADRSEPRSLYAPVYAPVILPIEADVAVFPRGDRAILIATPYLPEDTTFHAGHDHPRPWLDARDQRGMADRIGLFAVPVAGGDGLARKSTGASEGPLMLEVPAGEYVVSVESWSPELRRAGRSRAGMRIAPAPADIATVSDLLLLRRTDAPPESLEEALPYVSVRSRTRSGDSLAIAWELTGLGFRPEVLEYAVSVERTDQNVLRRLGAFLRLADRPQPLDLSWQEPGPEYPAPQFRHLDLDLPPLDPGRYQITLTLRTAARSDVVVTRDLQVVD